MVQQNISIRRLALAACSILLLCSASRTFAGDGRWSVYGTPRQILQPVGDLRDGCLYIDQIPGISPILLTACIDGLFVSRDRGEVWEKVGEVTNDSTLLAFVLGTGGANTGVAYVAPVTGDTINISKTVDNAATWQAITSNPPGARLYTLAVDPKNSDVVFAGTDGKGIYVTIDGGSTWSPANSGLNIVGGVSDATAVNKIAIDPLDTKTIYAAISGGNASDDGIYVSTDGGMTWTQTTLAGHSATDVAASGETEGIVFAEYDGGVWQTMDGGATWKKLSIVGNSDQSNQIAIDYASPKHVVVIAPDTAQVSLTHLYSSVDGGSTWTEDDVQNLPIRNVVFDGDDPTRLYASGATIYGGGVLTSLDAGKSWQYINKGILTPKITTLSKVGDTLYAGTDNAGLAVSNDGGKAWSTENAYADPTLTADSARITAIAASPGGPPTLYLGTGDGLHLTSDDGKSWTRSNLLSDPNFDTAPTAFGVTVLAPAGDAILAGYDIPNGGTGYDSGLVRSTDGGQNWSKSGGLGSSLRALAVAPTDPDIVYAGASTTWDYEAALFKSIDGGASWSPLSLGVTDATDIAIDPTDARVIYVAADASGSVLKSSDGGTNWKTAKQGLSSDTIFHLAIDPHDPDTLYAATKSNVYVTHDGASNWQILDSTLASLLSSLGAQGTPAQIEELYLDPNDSTYLYMGTDGGEILQYHVTQLPDSGSNSPGSGGGGGSVNLIGISLLLLLRRFRPLLSIR